MRRPEHRRPDHRQTEHRRADRPLRHRKARDRAAILPLVGAILLLPPIAVIFRVDATLAGIPLLVVYVFAVWAGLILAAAALAPRLSESDAAVEETVGEGGVVAGGAAGESSRPAGPPADTR